MKGRVWMIKIYAMQLGSPFPSSTVHCSDGWFPFIFGDVFWKGGSEWLNICNGAWQRQMKSVVPMAMRLTQLKGPSYLGQLCDELSTSQLTTGATRYISAELFWPLTCTGSCTIHSPLRMDSFFSAGLVFQCQDRPKENLKFFWVMLSGTHTAPWVHERAPMCMQSQGELITKWSLLKTATDTQGALNDLLDVYISCVLWNIKCFK